ncbi:MAG: AraC family transcriptional regulator [Oceanospirillaceae bacterium]|uniref:AraC family transcriptional regulator n=1 Tax=unclassified Thalassolituus TaxID=2624967 RepID=UPI000C407402|nr:MULTISPECIES: AraC family transcriptional regulator [unclassified Thalassolituus]MAS26573.1 AraC family transcriptional regulator [Oceanospirillaceae bacterium]MBL34220.1 AraC family transcriptional regulator [Oceanospirillaceae bacterium]MBS53804.1 AraC family transcriptional regulator [Oceanospirillaceae bacterium]
MSEREIPPSHDPLGEVLQLLKLSGTLYCRSHLTAPWSVEFPPFEHSLMFHIVAAGQCWLHVDGQPARLLKEGHLALLPHGQGHCISGGADPLAGEREKGQGCCQGLFDIPVEKVSERLEVMHFGGGGEASSLICGVARFDHLTGLELTRCLPLVIHIDQLAEEEQQWLHSSMRFIEREAANPGPGSETLITHLADIMILQAIRHWIKQSGDTGPGWLTALRDRQIGRLLAAFHRHPEQDWPMSRMCSVANMSRSVFAQKFTSLMGEPAGRYIIRWRMMAAREMLQNSNRALADIAQQSGYASEAAFSRAFKREFNRSPGSVRSESRIMPQLSA